MIYKGVFLWDELEDDFLPMSVLPSLAATKTVEFQPFVHFLLVLFRQDLVCPSASAIATASL
jgi:hypothetical protein